MKHASGSAWLGNSDAQNNERGTAERTIGSKKGIWVPPVRRLKEQKGHKGLQMFSQARTPGGMGVGASWGARGGGGSPAGLETEGGKPKAIQKRAAQQSKGFGVFDGTCEEE